MTSDQRQEALILEVSEQIDRAMAARGISGAELAERLGRTKGYITRVLMGDKNLTLRALADFADALACNVSIEFQVKR